MNVLIAACLALALACGVQTFRIGALKEEAATQKAALATAQAQAEHEAREREQQMADGARKAADDYSKNVARVRAGADGARTELDRLRDAIASSPAGAASAPACGSDDASRARTVVGQCAATLQTLAGTADQCEARLTGLQDYIRGIMK